jgi:uncharacterized protein (DUF2141 family)
MRHLTNACALLLLLLTAVPSEAGGQLQMNPADMPMMLPPGKVAKTGTGKLRGRVVAADTGSIVRRAQVRISSPDIGSKTAFTDGQGRYEFKDLPAGRFNLSVSKSGFVSMQYGQTRPFEPGKPIDLVDAQLMEKVDIALPRGSAVSGRILDEFGEPVADASVSAMRMQYTGGKRRLVQSGRNSMTNDLGQFRLFGLPPGEYYVSVTMRTMDSMILDMMGSSSLGGPTGSNNNSGYAATYYPGTPNPAEAQRLSLTVGQEAQSIDIQMQPVRLARITGNAVSSDGKPMTGAMVMLISTMKDAVQFMPGGTSMTDKDGNFTLSGVAPGEYTVQAQSLAALMSQASQAMALMGGEPGKEPAPEKAMEREFAMANVTVAGEDVTGLTIAGARGAKARGYVIFEGGTKPESLASLRLMAGPTDPDNVAAAMASFGMAAVKETGAFEIDGLVGGRIFRFMEPPKGWFLKRITHESDDVTDKGFDFKPGQDVDGFEIVLTTKSQAVSGSVTNDKGEAVKEYTVAVFPEDPQKWTVTAERWRASARPDQKGEFKIATLPPGNYLAIAVEYVAQGEWTDPEWLARMKGKATRFTLDEGTAKRLDLKLAGS